MMITRADILTSVYDLHTDQSDMLARACGAWFAEHAEMDRDRFLTLLDEAKAMA